METYTEELIETYEEFEDERIRYKDSTYDIISKVAFLIGVPKHIFENEHEPPKLDIYERLNKDKNARIIRNLCIIRTAIERGFKHISEKMKYQYKTILSVPEHIPQESIDRLTFDGVNFYKSSNTKLNQHIIELNRIISDRIVNKLLSVNIISW